MIFLYKGIAFIYAIILFTFIKQLPPFLIVQGIYNFFSLLAGVENSIFIIGLILTDEIPLQSCVFGVAELIIFFVFKEQY